MERTSQKRDHGTIRLQVLGRIEHRDVALRTVSAACRLAPVEGCLPDPATFQAHLVSAVGEAFNNIALHGFRGAGPGVIEIDITVDDRCFDVQIRDCGASFDPRGLAPPDLAALPESGLGVFIMRSFVDEVDYRPGRPNVLRLVKWLR